MKDPDVLERVAERNYTLVTNNAAECRRLYADLDLHAGLIIIVPTSYERPGVVLAG